ncbi:uncharacterized protein LOC115705143 [Cannabis sativa]|uniref:uncharacterized protein LOC115705143 n=1 Tax=Cannabis sativa TaxID=3483 RepID=UPI0029CA3FC0|nr:uncharacterized protein LOC115705143 [Cannabis sativa]
MEVMNITNRNAVDLSSFFLFEVTGDSEFCSKFDSEDTSVSLDEDDAESCSWGISADDDLLYASIGYEHDSIGEEEFVIDYLEEDEDETTSDPAYRKWSSGEINNIVNVDASVCKEEGGSGLGCVVSDWGPGESGHCHVIAARLFSFNC